MSKCRGIKEVIKGLATSDGGGVQLTRIIGSPYLNHLDPFLLLDVFGSDKPQDYIGGFPSHPHRGFETVTYMLSGKMRHKDSAGNEGVIEAGGVQWMTAGSGIIHSEMPEQEEGLLSGFQLWVNLPASHKMTEPKYQEFSKNEVPIEVRGEDCKITVIAGETSNGTKGVIINDIVEPVYWNIQLNADSYFCDDVASGHNAFIYVMEGGIVVENEAVLSGQLAVLSDGSKTRFYAKKDSRFLLIAGKPIREPIARGGPFVMNTKEEIQQAFSDYRTGRLVG